GSWAIWSGNGRELFYDASTSPASGGAVMSVDVKTGASLSVGVPRELFKRASPHAGPPRWDVTPDGRHFLILKYARPEVSKLIGVGDWFEELRRRSPVRN